MEVINMPRKLEYEFIREQFEKSGWTLLSKKYINSKKKLNVMCDNGHKIKVRYDQFKDGIGCSICSFDKKRLSIDFVKSELEKYGFILISKKYISAIKKIKIKCKEGHITTTTWSIWKEHKSCSECSNNKKRISLGIILNKLNILGIYLLSKHYTNNKQKLKLKCKNGHIFYSRWNDIDQGHTQCRQCYLNSKIVYDIKDIDKFYKYRIIVQRLTRKMYKQFKELINPNNLERSQGANHHLDHKFSVLDGFLNNISPEIISNLYNLQMLPWLENSIYKKGSSSISYKELMIGWELYNIYYIENIIY